MRTACRTEASAYRQTVTKFKLTKALSIMGGKYKKKKTRYTIMGERIEDVTNNAFTHISQSLLEYVSFVH